MADTTKSGESVQRSRDQELAVPDPGELLISDDALWSAVPPSKSALGCGTVRKVGISLRTGELVDYWPPCRSYTHQPCAEHHVKGHLARVIRAVGDERSGYGIVLAEEEFDSKPLRQRLDHHRRNHPHAGNLWYRFVARDDDTVWVFGNINLTGRLRPVLMEVVDDLLAFAAEAFRLPGVRLFHGTQKGFPSRNTEGSNLHSFGSMTDKEKEVFLPDVADEVRRRLGVEIDPANPVTYGRDITLEQYIECADWVLDQRE